MPDPDSISGDIISSATFLSGLLLVYIGNLNTGYGAYSAEQKADVRSSFSRRAWGAFVAFVLAACSVALALASSWFDNTCLLLASVILLLIVFVGGIISALMMVMEIA